MRIVAQFIVGDSVTDNFSFAVLVHELFGYMESFIEWEGRGYE